MNLQERNRNFHPKHSERIIFYICVLGTIVTSLFAALSSMFMQNSKSVELASVGLAIFCALFLAVITFTDTYEVGKIILCLMVSEICIPMFSLIGGGASAVASCFMIMGLIFPCILLQGKSFYIVYTLSIVTTILMFVMSIVYPIEVVQTSPIVQNANVCMAVMCVSIVLSVVMRFQMGMYNEQKRRMEESMHIEHEARKEAEAAAKAKTEFLSNMSHEIRTPMNAIVGIVDLLKDENLSATGRDYLSTMHTSSQALLQIIDDLLDYSKMKAGELKLDVKEYHVGEIFQDVYQILEFKVKDKPQIAMKKDFDTDIPSGLLGDEGRIRQIVMNLLSNAVKFTDQGIVTLSVKWMKRTPEYGVLRIEVSDTGRGIREDEKNRIFAAFEQADSKVNRSKGGSGLGLAICKMLTDMMGGTISVDSRFGVGSTFTVEIPQQVTNLTPAVFEEEKKTAKAHNIISFQAPKAKVLVVDDNRVNLKVASSLLKRYHMQATVAESGKQALLMLEKNRDFDIILMDYMMPEMDGIEATRKIKQEGINIPVIALTANTVEGAKDMYMNAGMVGYLPKPISLDELDKVLSKWIPSDKQDKQAN